MSNDRSLDFVEMFKDVNSEKDLREILSKFTVSELLSILIPTDIKERYGHVKEELLQQAMGLYDYNELREAVFTDWSDNSLQARVHELEESNETQKGIIDDITRKYSAILKFVSKMKVDFTIGDALELVGKE